MDRMPAMFCPQATRRSSTSLRVNAASHSGSSWVMMTSQTSALMVGSLFLGLSVDGEAVREQESVGRQDAVAGLHRLPSGQHRPGESKDVGPGRKAEVVDLGRGGHPGDDLLDHLLDHD